MKKQVLSFILALLPVVASADDSGSCGKYATYTYVEATKTLTISGKGDLSSHDYFHPSSWSSYREEIQNLIIEEGITGIGSMAFRKCSGLSSVTIPNSVVYIGEFAFADCTGLTSVHIPKNVQFIGPAAFGWCDLDYISVDEENAVYQSPNNCNAVIDIRNDMLVVGTNHTVIPENVKIIGDRAFSGCEHLESINLPSGLTDIYDYAFGSCYSLQEITIPQNVRNIQRAILGECHSLTKIVVDAANTVYDSRENCNGIIETASNTLIIGIQETVIPNTVTTIGSEAYYGCYNLTSVNIPSSVTCIAEYAFGFNYRLETIIIPSSVTSIGSKAFYALMPKSVVSGIENPFEIPDDAFEWWGSEDFYQKVTLYVPAGTKPLYEATAGWNQFAKIVEMRNSVSLNEVNFPDPNFRAALAKILGISEGDEITAEKIAATTSLYVSGKSIADLTGIEHFTALELLHCYSNQLISLNVSNNTALIWLYCDYNQLTSLDVSKNTVLELLYCHYNQLTSLDVSNNTALTNLSCSNNQLTSLDVSNNTALTNLSCENNQLTSLDVSKNTALTRLSCYENQLTSLDVSKNTALEYLYCYENQLTSLDVSANTALTDLWCFSNQIKGETMDALVKGLPMVENGDFFVINTKDANEGNVCTKSQVAVAKGKGWTVYDFNGWYSNKQEYEGSDPSAVETIEADAEPQNARWYTIDGKKLSGEPTRKGIYIKNGKKVVK